jgi:hypothetical protein
MYHFKKKKTNIFKKKKINKNIKIKDNSTTIKLSKENIIFFKLKKKKKIIDISTKK